MNEQRRNFLSGLLALPVALATKTKWLINGTGECGVDNINKFATSLKPFTTELKHDEGFVAGMKGEISKAVKQAVEMPDCLVQTINDYDDRQRGIVEIEHHFEEIGRFVLIENVDPTDTYFYYCGTFGVEELPSLNVLIEKHRKF